jgi:hypothetical protein
MPNPFRDVKAELEASAERRAICVVEGGLSEDEAGLVAERQVMAMIKVADDRLREAIRTGKAREGADGDWELIGRRG